VSWKITVLMCQLQAQNGHLQPKPAKYPTPIPMTFGSQGCARELPPDFRTWLRLPIDTRASQAGAAFQRVTTAAAAKCGCNAACRQ